jgi:hypothetical protein
VVESARLLNRTHGQINVHWSLPPQEPSSVDRITGFVLHVQSASSWDLDFAPTTNSTTVIVPAGWALEMNIVSKIGGRRHFGKVTVASANGNGHPLLFMVFMYFFKVSIGYPQRKLYPPLRLS